MSEFILRWLRGRAGESGRDEPGELPGAGEGSGVPDEIREVWDLTDLADDAVEPPPPPPVAEILRRAGRGSGTGETRTPRPSGAPPSRPVGSTESPGADAPGGGDAAAHRPARRRGALRAFQAAAVLVVGIGIGVLTTTSNPGPGAFAAADVETSAGERTTVTLADGSIVHVAPESRLRIPGGPERAVELNGRAFFAVAADEERPFTVRTHGGEARVLGTRFDLRTHDDEFELVVVEGRVGVSAPRGEAEVGRSQATRWRPDVPPTVEFVEDVHAYLDWMGRTLVFQTTPLEEVIRELERRYGKTIRLADASLADVKVTAWFSGQEFDEVLLSICQVVAAQCGITSNGAVVGATSPSSADESAER